MRALQFFLVALPATVLVSDFLSEMPSRIAIHWGFFGAPDGSAPRTIAFVVALGATASVSLYSLVRSRDESGVPELVTLTFLATLFAGVWGVVCVANHGCASWEEARLSPWILAASIGAACLAAWLVARLVRLPSASPISAASIGLRPGQRAAFFSHIASPLLMCGALVVLGFVVFLTLNASWFVAALLGSVGALMLVFARVSLSIDVTGMRISYGPFSFPQQTFPLSDVVQAEAIDVRPMAYGGWGYRGSLRFFGKAALVLRAGAGLKLSLRSGQSFVVTMDDAETAAGLLNDLVGQE